MEIILYCITQFVYLMQLPHAKPQVVLGEEFGGLYVPSATQYTLVNCLESLLFLNKSVLPFYGVMLDEIL